MERYRLFISGSGCKQRTDKQLVTQVLNELVPGGVLHQPFIIDRAAGTVGVAVTEKGIFTVVGDGAGLLSFEISSFTQINEQKYLELMGTYVSVAHIDVGSFTPQSFSRMECQEPRCTRPASKEYNGMLVCQDHYEQYLHQEEQNDWEADYR